MTQTTPADVDILLFKDGNNFIMKSKSSAPVRVRLAFVDTAVNSGGTGLITAVVQGEPSDAEYQGFLDDTKAEVERFVQSGELDRERELIRLRQRVEELSGSQPVRS